MSSTRHSNSSDHSKKIFDESVSTDSGFITSELLSSEQQPHSEEIKPAADKSSYELDTTTKTTAEGKSQSTKDNELESYTDSGIVSGSNLSTSASSQKISDLQPYVPEYIMRALSGHNNSRKPQHPTLHIEKYFEQDEDGYTKLHIAILHNIEPAIQLLISYAPDASYLNIKNYSGQSALHLAVLMQQTITIKRLIDAGADINIRDNRCNSPLHLAVIEEDINSLKVILGAMYPAKSTQGLKPMANLEQWNFDGETCFYVACKLRNIPIMKLLARYGANINAREGRSGYSPIHLAVETHSNDVMKFLCEECSTLDIDAENYGGLTAYQLSLLTSQDALSKYLMSRGATAYYTPDSDYEEDDSDVSTNEFEELEKNQLVNKIAEIAVN